ncbi:G-protein coupled receptor Mth2 [Amphibalanus amphitrite]|uniref:G-protein coupled receptor Mth2 n=1 Tax=Amphibalanus amphitrite TaxID=1232801 RepID=A0A6A4WD66_AMPAM|nr:G-protein coupled receptor Mth2 [Amphibalanus amphitrite]KAF0300802.1 G-protein coupled receptor Mth2 [Amphibalanus amphitrite]
MYVCLVFTVVIIVVNSQGQEDQVHRIRQRRESESQPEDLQQLREEQPHPSQQSQQQQLQHQREEQQEQGQQQRQQREQQLLRQQREQDDGQQLQRPQQQHLESQSQVEDEARISVSPSPTVQPPIGPTDSATDNSQQDPHQAETEGRQQRLTETQGHDQENGVPSTEVVTNVSRDQELQQVVEGEDEEGQTKTVRIEDYDLQQQLEDGEVVVEEEEDEVLSDLPSSLPTLRWGEAATITKCCPPEEVLVRQTDGQPPTCQPVPADQRWRPLLLNGRSGQRVAPSARSALVSGNVSCAGQHFWLDSTAGERFELLTTGHLYMRRADALLAPLSFCADRLLSRPERPPEEAGPPAPLRAGRAARVCTLSLQERSSLLDEQTLWPACARRRCLRKCCPRGLKVRWHDQLCVPQTGEQPWRPGFWQQAGNVTDYLTVAGNPPCRADDGSFRKVFALEPAYTDDDQFFLKEEWPSVEYEHPQKPGVLIDYHAAIVCFGESSGSAAGARVSAATHLYRALLLVSALFLLATLVVYCAVPELRNLHGRCLLSHVAALLAAYGCNLAAQLEVVYSSMAACQVIALVMYFSFLAACFWLNAMSFDIWLTFSRIRSAAPNRSQTGRFVKYSLYCWCCPLVLTAVVITMQFAPDWLVPPENFIRPRLGEQSCWFPGSLEMLVYFHVPILVLMTANLVFFVLTAKNLLQTEKDTRMAGRQKKGIEKFKIYVNLFIVMGVAWIAEALSIHLGPKEVWIITDVFNALQGFFIFILFTLRQNTRNTIRRHFASSPLCGRCCPSSVHLPGFSSSRKTASTSVPSGEAGEASQQHRQQQGEAREGSPARETAALCGTAADPEQEGEVIGGDDTR